MIKQGQAGLKRLIIKLVLLFVFMAIIVLSILFATQEESFASFQWEQLSPSRLIGELWEENRNESNHLFSLGNKHLVSSDVFQGDLLLLSDSDIRLINAKGDEVWYIAHEIQKPVLQINGQYILVYEQSGKSFMVIQEDKILLKDILEEEIAFGEITQKYILFISKNKTGYKRTVHMISPDNGMQIGALFIDDYYPFYAVSDHSPEKGSFLLYGLGMNSVRLSTIIRNYNINLNSSPIASIEMDGLYPVLYDNGKQKLFVGENAACLYDQELDTIWSKTFDRDITAAGLFENGETVFALHGQDNQISFFDLQGKEKKSIPLHMKNENIVVFKNTAAVITGSEVSFYNVSGILVDKVQIPGLSVDVHFIDEKKAFVLSGHEGVLHTISPKNLRNTFVE